MRDPEAKVLRFDQLQEWRRERQRERKRLVATNGCFDIVHRGHLEYLYSARQLGDLLIVGINDDASIKKLKGIGRPVNTESDRAYAIASLECVDAVIIFKELRATSLLRALEPQVYVKGGDYAEEDLHNEELRVLKEMGCEINLTRFIDGYSTTLLMKRIQQLSN